MKLFPRKIYNDIKEVLPKEEWVVLTGARQVGKTSLMIFTKDQLEREGVDCSYFNLENPDYLNAFNKHPYNLFEYLPDKKTRQYVFIDEIQYLDDPSNFLKLLFDEKRDKIKLIVSGSSAFYIDRKFKDSLAGRKFLFEIYPLDFEEFLVFSEEAELINETKGRQNKYYREKLAEYWREYSVFGGYPRVVLAGEDRDLKRVLIEEIATSYIKKDIRDAGIRNTKKYFSLLKVFAEQTGSLVNTSELANTFKLTINTIDDYLYTMEKSYHIGMIRPFYKNYRKEFTKMPKVFFFDQGLRNYLRGVFRDELVKTGDKGAWLENMFFSEMVKRKGGIDEIKYWRTQDKKEVDFVVGDRAYEIKAKKKDAKEKKYDTFKNQYPEKSFKFISEEDILEEFYGIRNLL